MPESSCGSRWGHRPQDDAALTVGTRRMTTLTAAVVAPGSHPALLDAPLSIPDGMLVAKDTGTQARHGQARPESAAVRSDLSLMRHQDAGNRPRHAAALRHLAALQFDMPWLSTRSRDAKALPSWDGKLIGHAGVLPILPPPPDVIESPWIIEPIYIGFATLTPPWILDYTALPTPAPGGRTLDVTGGYPWREANPAQSAPRTRWSHAQVIYGGQGVGAGEKGGWEDVYPRLIIPNRWSYFMNLSVDLVLLPERTSACVTSLTVNFSQDSTAATMSATIFGPGWADLMNETGPGEPRRVELSINGWSYVFVVETWTEKIVFNDNQVQITGRSLSFLLGGRFWLPAAGMNTEARTAAQIAAAALEDDWTLVWEAQDWLVPAGACSWSGAKPIDVVAKLAMAAGAFIESHATQKTLYVRPFYRVMPWNFFSPGTTEDILIPYDAVASIGREMRVADQANRAWVAGGEVGGKLVQVTRSGTDGALAAPLIQENLCTHEDAGRARGERELARMAQPPAIQSIECPFDNDEFPLLAIGKLVEIRSSPAVRGIVSAVSISVSVDTNGTLNVRQAARLGEGQENLFTAFRRLGAQPPLELATITAVYSDGSCVLEFPGGGTARARSAGARTVGQNVWVRGLVVQPDEAPDLGAPISVSV